MGGSRRRRSNRGSRRRRRGQASVETYQADRALHAMLARLSGGISPAALLLAYTDWLSHLAPVTRSGESRSRRKPWSTPSASSRPRSVSSRRGRDRGR